MSEVLGIFVGGASRRMGSPKGLLTAPDTGEPLVVRLSGLGRALGLTTVLVGRADPYRALLAELPVLDDEPAGIGPLGGLGALFAYAGVRPALAVACDLPFLDVEMLAALLRHAPDAPVVAPRQDGRWQPLFARYAPPRLRPALEHAVAEGVRSFQKLFARLPPGTVQELPLSAAQRRQLRDWDEPRDVAR